MRRTLGLPLLTKDVKYRKMVKAELETQMYDKAKKATHVSKA